ncbi:MAG: hypothetical protein ACJ8C8_17135 [Microvirga sp.]
MDLSAAAYPLSTSDWPMENALGAQNPFVALPIGPRQLFIGTHEETTIRNLRQRSPDEIVATVNGFVVSRARRYVWAVDTSQARFIQNHMSRQMVRPPFFPSMGRAHLSDAA